MKSMEIYNKIKELEDKGDVLYDELQSIFKEIHKANINPPYDDKLPIIQKMRKVDSELDNIEADIKIYKKEVVVAYKNEEQEVTNTIQSLVDNAVEVKEDGIIKHYIINPKIFNMEIFKDYYMARYSEYHNLLSNKYHYHVTFDNLEGVYEYHKPFYTNEPLSKLLKYCKNIMGCAYITDCTVNDMSKIKEYEIVNIKDEQGEFSYINHKYQAKGTYKDVVIRANTNTVYTAHFSDDKIFISYYNYNSNPLVTVGNYEYTYINGCIQQRRFTLVGSQLFKSDATEINKLKKNLDRMLDKKYFGRFDELNQLLKEYYHI